MILMKTVAIWIIWRVILVWITPEVLTLWQTCWVLKHSVLYSEACRGMYVCNMWVLSLFALLCKMLFTYSLNFYYSYIVLNIIVIILYNLSLFLKAWLSKRRLLWWTEKEPVCQVVHVIVSWTALITSPHVPVVPYYNNSFYGCLYLS